MISKSEAGTMRRPVVVIGPLALKLGTNEVGQVISTQPPYIAEPQKNAAPCSVQSWGFARKGGCKSRGRLSPSLR
jgi:hypothetical protein